MATDLAREIVKMTRVPDKQAHIEITAIHEQHPYWNMKFIRWIIDFHAHHCTVRQFKGEYTEQWELLSLTKDATPPFVAHDPDQLCQLLTDLFTCWQDDGTAIKPQGFIPDMSFEGKSASGDLMQMTQAHLLSDMLPRLVRLARAIQP